MLRAAAFGAGRALIVLRLATPDDAAEIAAIYAPFVAATHVSFEETPPSVEGMRAILAGAQAVWPWVVCERAGEVAGFAYASAHRTRVRRTGIPSTRVPTSTHVTAGQASRASHTPRSSGSSHAKGTTTPSRESRFRTRRVSRCIRASVFAKSHATRTSVSKPARGTIPFGSSGFYGIAKVGPYPAA